MRYIIAAASLFVAAMLVLLVAIPTYAQNGAPNAGWWLFLQMQNIDMSPGYLKMSTYRSQDDNMSQVNQIDSALFPIESGRALAYHPGFAANI